MLSILHLCYPHVNFINKLLRKRLVKYLLIVLLCCVLVGAYAQGDLPALLSTTQCSAEEQSHDSKKLQAFIDRVSSSPGSESKQLKKIFRGLHTEFLKSYSAHSDFDEIFTTGHYDCLTATALFCTVLDHFQYSYEIIETNYHIFLMVKTSDGDVMIESTDAIGGLISQKRTISERINEYQKNIPLASTSGNVFQYPFSIFQNISKNNLSGLLYFNQAVKAYNRQDWEACSILLEKANTYYTSPRCHALGSLLIQNISQSALDEKTKADFIGRLKVFWLSKSKIVAAN